MSSGGNQINHTMTSYCCAFCDGKRLVEIMDFGKVALAGGFLKPEQFATESFYPMHLCFCADCCAVQVMEKVSAEILFSDYFYFSSSIGTLRDHFAQYAAEVTAQFLTPASASVLEIGCNDGVLLRPLAEQGIRTLLGVDPATNVVNTIKDSRINIINDFFTEAVAGEVVRRFGKMDLVVANNVYAHIPDIQGTTRAIHQVLGDEGVFVFEVHYLGSVLEEMQYDMIYHEHLYYYSLTSAIRHFQRYGMVVFDAKRVPIHAGSIRFCVGKKGSLRASVVSDRVKAMLAEETAKGYDKPETFIDFADRVARRKAELMTLLAKLKQEGRTIAGYGASGRANTMIQYCGISSAELEYMIDDAPAKVGYCTPGSHFLIHPSSILDQAAPPDYLVVFAWSFLAEIQKRCARYLQRGGRIIVPLPEVKVIGASDKISTN
jgi:2-polyprenyl-3-methyl-5-hydroxy-6-metoxy-1,4-benzoquinol methylase